MPGDGVGGAAGMSAEVDYGPHKGQAVEIIQRNGTSARVRLPDGALLWVRTAGLAERPVVLDWKAATKAAWRPR